MSTDHQYEDATVRTWTDLLARIRFGTVKVGKRTVSSSKIKAVAGRLATYADADGSRVRPGIARVAVDLEVEYRTVKLAVGVLRSMGLLRLVSAGNAPGRADTYQLTIPAGLLDRDDVEVWSPGRHQLEIERVREANRGTYRAKGKPAGDDPSPSLRGPEGPAGDEAAPVDNPDLRGPEDPADSGTDDPVGENLRGPQGQQIGNLRGPQGLTCGVLGTLPPTTDRVTTTTEPTDSDLRTAVTGPRAQGPSEDPISLDVDPAPPIVPAEAGGVPPPGLTVVPPPAPDGLPDRCRHGLRARARPDGTSSCALCRREVATAPVLDATGSSP